MSSSSRQLLRWTGPVMVSLLLHLGAVATYAVAFAPALELPRIRLQEVVGVPMPPEPGQRATKSPAKAAPSGPAEVEKRLAQAPSAPSPAARAAEAEPGFRAVPPRPEQPEAARPQPPEKVAPPAEERDEAPPSPTKSAESADSEPQTSRSDSARADESVEHGEGDEAQAAESEAPAEESEVLPPGLIEHPAVESGEQLSELLVDGSRVVVYLRTDDLTKSPNARSIRRAIRAVGGYELYLGSSAFDPLTDFHWMLVRAPDLSVRTKTRLIAELAVDGARARAMVERIPPANAGVSWEERPTDLLGRPTGEGATGDWSEVGWAFQGAPPSRYLAGPLPWVRKNLAAEEGIDDRPRAEMEKVRIMNGPPDLVVVTSGLEIELGALESASRSVDIEGVLLAGRFREEALIVARLWLTDEEQARRFVVEMQQGLGELGQHPLARLLDLSPLMSQLELHQRGAEVTAWLTLEPGQAARLLALATMLMEAEGDEAGVVDVQSN